MKTHTLTLLLCIAATPAIADPCRHLARNIYDAGPYIDCLYRELYRLEQQEEQQRPNTTIIVPYYDYSDYLLQRDTYDYLYRDNQRGRRR